MASIIRYVAGFPKERELKSERFEDIRKQYKLGAENVDVWEYRGPLTIADFRALRGTLTSEEYLSLKGNINQQKKRRFLERARASIAGDPQLTNGLLSEELKNLPKTSKNFLPALEELLNHENAPLSQVNAQQYLLRQAESSGLYVPISFSYPYRSIGDLAYDKGVLVFVDENLKGDVTLRKTKEYFDQGSHGAGKMEEGVATIKMGSRRKNVDWDCWQSNSLRWRIDPAIRKEILKEKEEGIRFTRL